MNNNKINYVVEMLLICSITLKSTIYIIVSAITEAMTPGL